MENITILKKEVVYTVPAGTNEEERAARKFAQELYETYEDVQRYWNGTHEIRIVCKEAKAI